MTFLVLQCYNRNCIWWSWKCSKTQTFFSIHLQNLLPLPIIYDSQHIHASVHNLNFTRDKVASTNQSTIPNIHTHLWIIFTLPKTSCESKQSIVFILNSKHKCNQFSSAFTLLIGPVRHFIRQGHDEDRAGGEGDMVGVNRGGRFAVLTNYMCHTSQPRADHPVLKGI